VVDVGASDLHSTTPSAPPSAIIENALASAIERASTVGRWDVVAQLARELEARRRAAAGVRSLVDEQGRRPRLE
jgi:hypothetical protein